MDKKILHTVKVAAFGACMIFMAASCSPDDSQVAKAATAAADAVAPLVTVHVQNGVATLSGTVRDTAARSTLDSIVRAVKGVDSVIDNTTFIPPPPPPPSPVPVS